MLARIGGKLALPDLDHSGQIGANPGGWAQAWARLASNPVLRSKRPLFPFQCSYGEHGFVKRTLHYSRWERAMSRKGEIGWAVAASFNTFLDLITQKKYIGRLTGVLALFVPSATSALRFLRPRGRSSKPITAIPEDTDA
ncbi:hypothetical protein [Paraburkholderia sp. UCT2]|uniref:hypothetical protein n=1 Tax=Paraburkholderia sp. UCT2 TaxID=2615208 RepID=UPI001655EE15|nr:hypothetical protein [Paraburkholderia sp. UCT2]MBC8733136.1 hypothetical protein [Paraburkholderia sp. UCT2]